MKRFLMPIITVAAALLAFAALFPDQTKMISFREWRLSKDPDIATLQTQLDARQDSLRVLSAARDRIAAMEIARKLPRGSAAILTTADAGISATSRAAFDARVREELSPLGDSVRYPIRMHLVSDSGMVGGYLRIAVLPRDASEPCTLIVLVGDMGGRDVVPTATGQLVSTCGFYAAFGAPGAGMATWLFQTRGIHAAAYDAPALKVPQPRHRITDYDVISEPTNSACLAGNDAACEEAWGGSRWIRRLLARDSVLNIAGTVSVPPGASQLAPGRDLSDLRAAMTDARFRELWQSEKEPTEAYRDIEGRSIGLFVRDRLLLETEPHRPGPLRAELPFVLAAVLGLGAALLAVSFTKRQRS